MRVKAHFRIVTLAVISALTLGGCATKQRSPHPDDPWEGYNRAIFSFNENLDEAVLKPLATGYDKAAPLPVKVSVGNFFGNLNDVWTSINNLLQGKGGDGATDAARVLINTTVGIFGVFDVATEMGIEKHEEDLGQTFAVWGASSGPYFVVPFFGPKTIRSTVALPFDLYGRSAWRPEDVAARNSLSALRVVNVRATLLGADRAVDEGSLDKYGYIRDFYLQQRRYEIFDGNPPRERFDDSQADPLKPRSLAQVEADGVAIASMTLTLVADAPGRTTEQQ